MAELQKGIDHTGITVVFFCHDGKGNFLFNKRSQNCRDEHGCWDPGGGALEYNERVEDRLKKEVEEEYCSEIITHDFLGYYDVFRNNADLSTHWIALIFKVHINADTVANGEPHKFDELEWFRLDNLPEPLHSHALPILQTYRDKLKSE